MWDGMSLSSTQSFVISQAILEICKINGDNKLCLT